jgi:hypothetical protein
MGRVSDPLASLRSEPRVAPEAIDRAGEAIAATEHLVDVRVHLNLTRRSVVLIWPLRPGRHLVWYADADEEWRPARVVQVGDGARSHWAPVGEIGDLVAILREELGIVEE